jgi:aminoglycoside 6'-N-acetyltransferase I
MPNFTVTPLDPTHAEHLEQTAALLVAAFMYQPDTWDTLEEAREEVAEALEDGKINLIAVGEQGRVVGWVGAFHAYAAVWELHPLAVLPAYQGQGIGAALVQALEIAIQARGGLVVTLGTDDVIDQTSIAGKDLYPHVWAHIRDLQNVKRHAFGFYQKLGYSVTGIIPDANGFGKHDILMCKRLE